jgi:hypothetical protein
LHKIVDCHISIKAGNWIKAADTLIHLSSVNNDTPLSNLLSFPQKTAMIEFAGYMIILATLSNVYAPDYTLFFMDCNFDFKSLYNIESLQEMQL